MEPKTPVTRLQEYFAKRRLVPEFVLIEGTVGVHNPTFAYKVSGFGKSCVGRGSSKKEAKHAAAKSLLSILEGDYIEDYVEDPYLDASRENTVGALQDFCLTYMIHIPRYEEKSSTGLSHSKLFVVECKIYPLVTIGEGRSKRQAKQLAAYCMLIKLQEMLKDQKLDDMRSKSSGDGKQDKAVERLREQLKKELIISEKKVNTSEIDSDYSKLFNTEKCVNSVRLSNLTNEEFVECIPNPVEYFCQLMMELSSSWDKCFINTKPGTKVKILSLQIKDFRGATFFGQGCNEDDAFREATVSALKWFAVMSH